MEQVKAEPIPAEVPVETPPTVNQMFKRIGFWGIAALMIGVGIFGLQGRNQSLGLTATTSHWATSNVAGAYLRMLQTDTKGLKLEVGLPDNLQASNIKIQQAVVRSNQINISLTYTRDVRKHVKGYTTVALSTKTSLKPGTYLLVTNVKQVRSGQPLSAKLAEPVRLDAPIVIAK